VVVYQAYRPAIGRFAATHGYFGGEFSLNRMSWIKPTFLWMMYRSGWGAKVGQEVTLAIWLKRAAFDQILADAVPTSFATQQYETESEWKRTTEQTPVLVQWDPDHDPFGAKVERRAIQLGLRGEALARYAREWIVRIEDVSPFVQEQAQHVQARALGRLWKPREAPYAVMDRAVGERLQVSQG
jgi:hypothetical protein